MAARVHDPGILEHGQERRCALHGAGGSLDGLGQHGLHVGLAPCGRLGRIGGVTDDRQDRALDRCEHRLVGHLGALAQAFRQLDAAGATLAVCTVGHAADDLREDDAAVAAGASESPLAEGIGHGVQVTLVVR